MAFDGSAFAPQSNNFIAGISNSLSELKNTILYEFNRVVKKPVRLNYLLRDEDQSLIGSRERKEYKRKKAEISTRAGFDGVEIGGGTKIETPARSTGEDPYIDCLDPLAEITANVERLILFRGSSANGRRIYSDEAIKLSIDVYSRKGRVTTIRAFDATNNLENLQVAFDEIKKYPHMKVQAAMSYSLSPSRDKDFYVDLATKYINAGADELCIKDMAGTMTPEDADYIIRRIKKKHPNVPLTLHMHATSGKVQATLLAAVKAGIDTIDVAADGMCDWVGHAGALDMMFLLENNEDPEIRARAPVNVNKEALYELREVALESRVLHREFELPYDKEMWQALVESGLPGGLVTTFKDAIKILINQERAAQRERVKKEGGDYNKIKNVTEAELRKPLLEAIRNVSKVTKDAGYVEKVTPTSDYVAKQAAWNAYYKEKGLGEYAQIFPGFASYVLGELGYSIQKPDDWLIKLIEKKAKKERYNGRASARISNDEVVNTRVELIEAGFDPRCDEDVITVLQAGDDGAGIQWIKARQAGKPELAKGYEPPPVFPAYLNYKMEPSSPNSELKGLYELWQALGRNYIEIVAQRAQKIVMITDGASFAGVESKLKEKYFNQLKQEQAHDLARVVSVLHEAGFSGGQALHSISELNKMLSWRCKGLGVKAPTISSNGIDYTAHVDRRPEAALEPVA